MNFTMWSDYIKQKIRDTKSYLWMETFNVYGKILMMIDDLEGLNGVKEMDQPSDEELSRDIKRVLLILERRKEGKNRTLLGEHPSILPKIQECLFKHG